MKIGSIKHGDFEFALEIDGFMSPYVKCETPLGFEEITIEREYSVDADIDFEGWAEKHFKQQTESCEIDLATLRFVKRRRFLWPIVIEIMDVGETTVTQEADDIVISSSGSCVHRWSWYKALGWAVWNKLRNVFAKQSKDDMEE